MKIQKDNESVKKRDPKKIVGLILILFLLFSIIYSVYKIITSPSEALSSKEYDLLRSDYVLMLLQCCLGIFVVFLPGILEKSWSIHIPNYMYMLYFIFLFCAIYLGEVRSFYYLVPHWDTILHFSSGAMLGAFGHLLVSELNNSQNMKVQLSPFYIFLFALSFALAVGDLWEIYEYVGDSLFDLNMQKFRLEDGTILSGHAALRDTMSDLIVNNISALVVTGSGYFIDKKRSRLEQVNNNKAA